MKHIIIENLSSYYAAKKVVGSEPIVWRTTSLGLLEMLLKKGVAIESLEQNVTSAQCNAIGRAAYDFTEKATDFLNNVCGWRRYIQFDYVMGLGFAQLFHVLFYKAWLLSQETKKCEGSIVCVGNPQISTATNLNFSFDRFDTLYAMLAEQSDNNITVLHHIENSSTLNSLDEWVMNRPMSSFEKLLSIINNTPSSFLYKIWRKMSSFGIFKSAGIYPRSKTTLFIYKDCELIEESFLRFLLKGACCQKLPNLPGNIKSHVSTSLPDREYMITQLEKFALEALGKNGVEFKKNDDLAETCAKINAKRICEVLADLHLNLDSLTQGFEKITKVVGNGWIATNFFTSVVERMFGLYCKKNGTKVAAFEHGITLGLSKWAEYPAKYWGMLNATAGVYHWKKSLKDIRPYTGEQKILIGGLPRITSHIKLYSLQRFLARYWLGIQKRNHVIIYVADLERNNFIYGPYIDNDIQYKLSTEAIVDKLAKSYPNSDILLKLYPTHRYLESCEFESLISKRSNVRLVKDMDFRFIRAAADIIALSSSQSTLGWALGANCKTFVFEKKAMPVRLLGQILNNDVDSVRRVIVAENGFYDLQINNIGSELID
jgi:hypothetical protein